MDFSGYPVVRILPSKAESSGLIPGRGTKLPHASRPKKNQNIKQKQYCNKFNKDFFKKWLTSKKSFKEKF